MGKGKKALVIAVSEYDNDELLNLDFCKNDGEEVGVLLKELGYDVKKQLIGNVDGTTLQDEIIEFFGDPEIKHDDTVLFYYSGHGIPGAAGDVYLSSSNIDPTKPMKRGFSFDELTTMMESCRSKCLVTMLDCCYSGSAKISKSEEKARSKLAQNYQIEKINSLKQGEGKCLLSASLGFQESYAAMEGKHSFFTHYLLSGLRGADGKSVDNDGIVTPESLMQYIDSEIDKLPPDRRPSQTPLRKIETVGRIVLADHSNTLAKPTLIVPDDVTQEAVAESYVTMAERLLRDDRKKYDESIKLFDKALAISPKNTNILYKKGMASYNHGKYVEAIECFDEMLIGEPDNDRLWQTKGHILRALNQNEESIKCFQIAQRIGTGGCENLISIAGALTKMKRYDEAIKYYDEILKIITDDPEIWYWKISVLKLMNKPDEVEKCIDGILRIQAKELVKLENKANVLKRLGREREANEIYEDVKKRTAKIEKHIQGFTDDEGHVV